MTRLLVLAIAILATTACRQSETPAPANEAGTNITALDEGNLSGDTNITDVPVDDGDAPTDAETNAK